MVQHWDPPVITRGSADVGHAQGKKRQEHSVLVDVLAVSDSGAQATPSPAYFSATARVMFPQRRGSEARVSARVWGSLGEQFHLEQHQRKERRKGERRWGRGGGRLVLFFKPSHILGSYWEQCCQRLSEGEQCECVCERESGREMFSNCFLDVLYIFSFCQMFGSIFVIVCVCECVCVCF